MFNNLVNRHDAERVWHKSTDGDLAAVVGKVRGSSKQRTVRQWSDTSPPPTQWWSIPAMRRRWNRMISDDELVDFPAFVAEHYLRGRVGLRALSIGCGLGRRELRWAELGVFQHLDAYDIAPAAVAAGRAVVEEAGLGDAVSFHVGDVLAVDFPRRYDVVILEHSLHHLAPIPEVVAKLRGLLEPDGLLVADEFIGPRRFQWTATQLREAQHLLEQFPTRYRQMGARRVKDVVIRPSRLWMLLTDPSEAIDSERIPSSLHREFEVCEELPYGGALLHLAFSDISQNFLDEDDPTTVELLQFAEDREDDLMASGVLGSDFAAFVCRARKDTA